MYKKMRGEMIELAFTAHAVRTNLGRNSMEKDCSIHKLRCKSGKKGDKFSQL